MTAGGDRGRPSAWWAVAGIVVGVGVAILVGVNTSEGTGEISGVAAASLVVAIMALRKFRHRCWFWPYVATITLLHAAAIFFFVAPVIHTRSKAYIQLVWPDFFLIAGLGLLIERLTRGMGQDGEGLQDDAQGA
ncbi:MAG: hypothetical protein JWL96_1266 [Sphingomonas bacterium]|jgi:hypothetical protein|uniref:hypothetical protein n=1 Tax=Sphingomonas bacterium TaxID=1895847 RepID=UPI00263317C6|nr:hypothetical protein [Sphingomonas bacterium]MDB5709196.1 hypothetical protein [Sphingomonas bacterium]